LSTATPQLDGMKATEKRQEKPGYGSIQKLLTKSRQSGNWFG